MKKLKKELLRALKLEKEGHWNQAHHAVQPLDDEKAYWIHGYLHRREGDLGNASYWYTRAGRIQPDGDLDEEWQIITDAIQDQD